MFVWLPILTAMVVFWARNSSLGNIGVSQTLVAINITMNATTFNAIPVINFELKQKIIKLIGSLIFGGETITISLIFMWPEPKTIVFGAVEKGNIKAKLTLTVIGSKKKAEFKLLLIALRYKKELWDHTIAY